MKQVIPIPLWSGGMLNCFLIKGKEKHILVDTGVPDCQEKIYAKLDEHHIKKENIGLIILTHAHVDHFGSAGALKRELDIPVIAHKHDADFIKKGIAQLSTMKARQPQWWIFKQLIKNVAAPPCPTDIILKDNEEYDLRKWGVEGKLIHTPGHTPGSISVVLDSGEIIIMDMMASGILMGGVLFHKRVKHPPFHDDMFTLKRSFEKVLKEQGKTFYLGHGGPVERIQLEKYYRKYLKKLS